MRLILSAFFFLVISQLANAQLSKVLHQSFEIGDVKTVSLNLVGEYEIEKWAGNTILTETSIEIYDAKPGIFNHFIKEGRYEIIADVQEATAALTSKDSERKSIRTKKGECYEFIKLKIFVPDDFNIDDPINLVRQSISEASTID